MNMLPLCASNVFHRIVDGDSSLGSKTVHENSGSGSAFSSVLRSAAQRCAEVVIGCSGAQSASLNGCNEMVSAE